MDDNATDIDGLFRWPAGTAERLAKRGKLPHYVLPNGDIRFDRAEVEALVKRVPVVPAAAGMKDGAR